MPGRDGTGPMGQGPLTGGRRGNCVGAVPSFGRGGGRGGGRGWRNEYYATGLTGWQRAAQGLPQPVDMGASAEVSGSMVDPLARLEGKLDDVLQRLDRLEARENT